MLKNIIILIILTFSSVCSATPSATSSNAPTTVIKTLPVTSRAYASHDYIVQVLRLALDETKNEFGDTRVEFMTVNLGRNFILQLLDIPNILDIAASAPTKNREINFDSVKFPIFKGLLGYRMFLIPLKNKSLFQDITSPAQLKPLKACLVANWADANIMEENGYKVVRIKHYKDIFTDLDNGKCDYSPRGIIEGYSEAKTYNAKHSTQPIIAFDKFLLHYQLPMVFYTGHKNFELAARIELGLKRANSDGRLLQLMASNPVTKDVFPLSKWQNTPIFKLSNLHFVKSMPVYDNSLWLTLPNG